MPNNEKTGSLTLVATPIGNSGDITIRAVESLNSATFVICEERRIGSRLLKQLGINKTIIELNEHNENDMVQDILFRLIDGENLALISDCGTPVFSDPGRKLLALLYESGIPITSVPGPSSLMTAISLCPFNLDSFLFLGFLPPKTEQRTKMLAKYVHSSVPLILMDTPYRLNKLLNEVRDTFGKYQKVMLACDLTLPIEKIYLGSVQEVLKQVKERKAEFILILDTPHQRQAYR